MHKKIETISPTTITFITTRHCTSACKNCCFECSPQLKDKLTVKEMKGYLDRAMTDFSSIRVLVLTGGECFTYSNKLSDIIRYATSKYQLVVRIVTNAYWATTLNTAKKRLEPYIDAGLKEINYSTGDEHQEFIPFENIKNACIAAIELGLSPLINIESGADRVFSSQNVFADKDLNELILQKKMSISNGLWVPFKTGYKNGLHNNRKRITFNNNRCTNLFSAITIDPQHRMIACCGLTAKYIKYLDLGDARKTSIKELYDKQFSDFLKIWLFVEGPHQIIKFISKYTEIGGLKYEDLHECQVCAIIFNTERFLETLRLNYIRVFTNVMLKYNVLSK